MTDQSCGATTTVESVASAPATTSSSSRIFDVVIIGGGLSGLMVASDYHHRTTGGTKSHEEITSSSTLSSVLPATNNNDHSTNRSNIGSASSWKLLEARPVLGGRLTNDEHVQMIDLGGAWLWPQHQPNIRRLLPHLNIRTFVQPDDPSSIRIVGGAIQLIRALSHDLPSENIELNTPVTKCTLITHTDNEMLIQVQTGRPTSGGRSTDGANAVSGIVTAQRVVIAVLPPKLICKHILQFEPPLSSAKYHAMESSHTWMAGVTKISLVYVGSD